MIHLAKEPDGRTLVEERRSAPRLHPAGHVVDEPAVLDAVPDVAQLGLERSGRHGGGRRRDRGCGSSGASGGTVGILVTLTWVLHGLLVELVEVGVVLRGVGGRPRGRCAVARSDGGMVEAVFAQGRV